MNNSGITMDYSASFHYDNGYYYPVIWSTMNGEPFENVILQVRFDNTPAALDLARAYMKELAMRDKSSLELWIHKQNMWFQRRQSHE